VLCVLIRLGSLFCDQQTRHRPLSESYKPRSYIATCIWGLRFVAVWHGDTLEWDTGTVLDWRDQLWPWLWGSIPCQRSNFAEGDTVNGILVLYSTDETSFDLDFEGSVRCHRANITAEDTVNFRKACLRHCIYNCKIFHICHVFCSEQCLIAVRTEV
jgi:hypothetical protein